MTGARINFRNGSENSTPKSLFQAATRFSRKYKLVKIHQLLINSRFSLLCGNWNPKTENWEENSLFLLFLNILDNSMTHPRSSRCFKIQTRVNDDSCWACMVFHLKRWSWTFRIVIHAFTRDSHQSRWEFNTITAFCLIDIESHETWNWFYRKWIHKWNFPLLMTSTSESLSLWNYSGFRGKLFNKMMIHATASHDVAM